MDVLEIDAASNNGVDNIRELRDDAIYTPSEVQRRVYIIDEVHMLSISAFNALLKTIEEPPEHLMFILATTELHKVPATILSRCQRFFSFRRISPEDVATRLQYVASQEHISLGAPGRHGSGPDGQRRPAGRRKPFGSVRIRHPRSSNPRGRISMPGPGRRAEGSGVDGRHCRGNTPGKRWSCLISSMPAAKT